MYSFTDMKKNPLTIPFLWDRDWFRPDLGPYNVDVMKPGQAAAQKPQSNNAPAQAANPGQQPQALVVPDLRGMAHTDATKQLQALGVDVQKDVKYFKGGPATRAVDTHRIRNQEPKPGTPLEPGMRVSLQVWEAPAVK
ncbi:MAG: PASTA domain-containing protein [Planctomycetaceae bacterium]